MSKKEIYKSFSGKLIGNKRMKDYVCETLSFMSDEIILYITQNCWFVSSFDDAWAFTFTGNDIKDQHLVFLSDELLEQNRQEIYRSIAHEIGHVILGHRNSILEKQTKEEIKNQEIEAGRFVDEIEFN